jgi:predicted aspartyl protease
MRKGISNRLRSSSKLSARPVSIRAIAALLFLLVAASGSAVDGPGPDLQSLYAGHHWFELRDAISGTNAPALYQGAVASAFNQREEAETYLQRVIAAAPASQEAREAREMLMALDMRSGLYNQFVARLNEKIASNPAKPVSNGDRAALAAMSGIPDMAITSRGASSLHYEMLGASLAVPLLVDGKPATFLLDSDANMSAVSESEAARLGMKFNDNGLILSGETGETSTNNRIAVAKEIVVGNFHFTNVAFLVLPDDREPFVGFPSGKRGILGLPVMFGFQTLRWKRDGAVEFGFAGGPKEISRSNICFDAQDPVTQIEFQHRRLEFILDTGASDSELWPPFAKEFSELLSQSGKKESRTLTGFTGTEDFDVVTLPVVHLGIGGFNAVLQPAQVLMKVAADRGKYYFGRAGMDIFSQSHMATIDFGAMTFAMN